MATTLIPLIQGLIGRGINSKPTPEAARLEDVENINEGQVTKMTPLTEGEVDPSTAFKDSSV